MMRTKSILSLLFLSVFILACDASSTRGDAITLEVSIQGRLGDMGGNATFPMTFSSSTWPDPIHSSVPITLFSVPYNSVIPTPMNDAQGNPINPFDQNYYGGYYLNYQNTFDVQVTLKAVGPGAPSSDVATIHYTGNLSGQFTSLYPGGEIGGGAGGNASSAQLSGWSPSSSIPWWVIEPWLHADKFDVLMDTAGNGPTQVFGEVFLDPESGPRLVMPVPEPSLLAFSGFVGLAAVGRKFLRRGKR